ncbi:type II secretion system protein [Ketobacter sp.]|uniref:type II secretion system protein n=1 Tax=Ketobacter sp. TaxID=2083498 RepID=UPI000F25C520|nr:hypothetical protein [Ketobacter sp.]RLU00524.1 MAG: type II secretion system protein [Ketobacter sp.]
MIKIDYRTQSGLSLIYVLISISVFSAVLIHRGYMNSVKEERRAFEFTLAQLQNALNLANAYRLEHNRWPRNNANDCLAPDRVISGMGGMTNGWGYDIVGSGDCGGNNATYTLSQIIPDKYYARFRSMMDEDISRSHSGVPAGYSRMFVRVNRQDMNGGALVEFGELSNDNEYNPLEFTSPLCTGVQVENYVYGFDGMCISARKNFNIREPWNEPPDPTVRGFISYRRNVFLGKQAAQYRGIVENASDYYPNWEGNPLDLNGDGLEYADWRCPKNTGNPDFVIDVVYMAWCE